MILQRTRDLDAVKKKQDDYRRELDEQIRFKNQGKPGRRRSHKVAVGGRGEGERESQLLGGVQLRD
jgi:hypothetical protein